MKLSRKTVAITAAFLVAVVVAVSLIIATDKRKNYWQERAGDYNLAMWQNIQQMAWHVDKCGVTVDGLKEMKGYINATVHNSSSIMMPPFNGSGKAHAFLGTYYDSFASTLISQSMNEEKLNEGLSLFEEMNNELLKLCEDINKAHGETDREKWAQLVDSDSETYEKTAEKIKAFCNKYAEKISRFNNGQ